MNKDKLLEALNKLQNGEDAGCFHDEIGTLIELVSNISDEEVSAAWDELKCE